MCYSSYRDFGRGVQKDVGKETARKPEAHPTPKPEEHPEPRVQAEASRLRDFINRRKVHKAVPATDRMHEKV
ncbi:hypothetical protein LVY72_23650 [Arthrobacter sp. I2-34]|uniref:Uncharacterized protein n=1 Tax=Arthrobacter hankyongi TaxID=2904801 RepID=A0ABS9LDY1_9MICC|nr:hypothetical protein [Arthrobacter hankyongi]MCG2624889.1 hypothetical protein [Arthrobacter hankyongi]